MTARQAVRLERYLVNVFAALALVGGLAGGAWLEIEWDFPDGLGAILGVIVPCIVLGAAYWMVKSFLPIAACPECLAPWDALSDSSWKAIAAGHCPECRARV